MPDINQNPEQIARDKIDALLEEAGWNVQNAKKIAFMSRLMSSKWMEKNIISIKR